MFAPDISRLGYPDQGRVYSIVCPLPISKDKAIVITARRPGDLGKPVFPLSKEESQLFVAPEFARHSDEAWSVGHLEAQIGAIEPTHHTAVDDFNRLFLDIFNMGSGNMLLAGNVLTWNVWFNHPELVDQQEWRDHAEKWRTSIDVDHTTPDRQRTPARYHDGTPFRATDELLNAEIALIHDFMRKQMSLRQRLLRISKSVTSKLRLPTWLGG